MGDWWFLGNVTIDVHGQELMELAMSRAAKEAQIFGENYCSPMRTSYLGYSNLPIIGFRPPAFSVSVPIFLEVWRKLSDWLRMPSFFAGLRLSSIAQLYRHLADAVSQQIHCSMITGHKEDLFTMDLL